MAGNVLARLFLCLSLIGMMSLVALAAPQVPFYFAFGDSLADPGNNNNLNSFAKANYAPYGVDFPGGANPTGRFTNGRTYVDFIAQLLGFTSFLPPITGAAVGNFIGVNYASASVGILDDTGKTYGDRIPLRKQLMAHQRIVEQLPTILNTTKDNITSLLSKCIYTIGIGSNDYINNYFLPQFYDSSAKYSPPAFAKLLITEHNRIVKGLYDLGARKMAFVGVGHIGLTPYEFNFLWPGVANATKLNDAVDLFNAELKGSVNTLAKDLPEAKLTYLNTVGISSGGPAVPVEALKPCCQNIEPVSQVTCKIGDSTICPDRSKALFFDNIHPTEAVNQFVSARYYASKDPSDASPYDIQKLATLTMSPVECRNGDSSSSPDSSSTLSFDNIHLRLRALAHNLNFVKKDFI